jgi:hypothetical protein
LPFARNVTAPLAYNDDSKLAEDDTSIEEAQKEATELGTASLANP